MKLTTLSNRLKRYARHKAIEIELFKFLKENPHLVIQYNINQLFEQSIGADGIDLGFYSYSVVKYDNIKKPGDPFTMIDTGRFFNGMYIKVLYRNIIISSNTPDLPKILENPFFITNDFFGLTDENLILLKRFHTTPHIQQWLKTRILNG